MIREDFEIGLLLKSGGVFYSSIFKENTDKMIGLVSTKSFSRHKFIK